MNAPRPPAPAKVSNPGYPGTRDRRRSRAPVEKAIGWLTVGCIANSIAIIVIAVAQVVTR